MLTLYRLLRRTEGKQGGVPSKPSHSLAYACFPIKSAVVNDDAGEKLLTQLCVQFVS